MAYITKQFLTSTVKRRDFDFERVELSLTRLRLANEPYVRMFARADGRGQQLIDLDADEVRDILHQLLRTLPSDTALLELLQDHLAWRKESAAK